MNSKKEVKIQLDDLLYRALEYIIEVRGYSSVAEYFRDKIRDDAERLGFFQAKTKQEVTA